MVVYTVVVGLVFAVKVLLSQDCDVDQSVSASGRRQLSNQISGDNSQEVKEHVVDRQNYIQVES